MVHNMAQVVSSPTEIQAVPRRRQCISPVSIGSLAHSKRQLPYTKRQATLSRRQPVRESEPEPTAEPADRQVQGTAAAGTSNAQLKPLPTMLLPRPIELVSAVVANNGSTASHQALHATTPKPSPGTVFEAAVHSQDVEPDAMSHEREQAEVVSEKDVALEAAGACVVAQTPNVGISLDSAFPASGQEGFGKAPAELRKPAATSDSSPSTDSITQQLPCRLPSQLHRQSSSFAQPATALPVAEPQAGSAVKARSDKGTKQKKTRPGPSSAGTPSGSQQLPPQPANQAHHTAPRRSTRANPGMASEIDKVLAPDDESGRAPDTVGTADKVKRAAPAAAGRGPDHAKKQKVCKAHIGNMSCWCQPAWHLHKHCLICCNLCRPSFTLCSHLSGLSR